MDAKDCQYKNKQEEKKPQNILRPSLCSTAEDQAVERAHIYCFIGTGISSVMTLFGFYI